jgi:hypothetical protein
MLLCYGKLAGNMLMLILPLLDIFTEMVSSRRRDIYMVSYLPLPLAIRRKEKETIILKPHLQHPLSNCLLVAQVKGTRAISL